MTLVTRVLLSWGRRHRSHHLLMDAVRKQDLPQTDRKRSLGSWELEIASKEHTGVWGSKRETRL